MRRHYILFIVNRFAALVFIYLLAVTSVSAEPEDDLFNQAKESFDTKQDYADAASKFDQLIKLNLRKFNNNALRLRLGQSYFLLKKYDDTITALSPLLVNASERSDLKDIYPYALYYTGLAQVYKASALTSSSDSFTKTSTLTSAVTNLTTLLTKNPPPDLVEDAMYGRALAYIQSSDFDNAEKDITQIIEQFPGSLRRTDDQLLLGQVYGVKVGKAISDKKPFDDILKKGLDLYTNIYQAEGNTMTGHDAAKGLASLLLLKAQSTTGASGSQEYAAALEAYRKIPRKEDIVPYENAKIENLKKQIPQAIQQQDLATVDRLNGLVKDEQSKLQEFENGPNPEIEITMNMAICFNAMNQPDEARTILHRLQKLYPSDLPASFDLQLLSSYTQSGQADKANKAMVDFIAKNPNDRAQLDAISYQLAAKLLENKDYQGAFTQAMKGIKDFPNGSCLTYNVEIVTQALTALGRGNEIDSILGPIHLESNPTVLYNRAEARLKKPDLAGALDLYRKVVALPNSGPYGQAAALQIINVLDKTTPPDYPTIIKEVQNFVTKYPTDKAVPAMLIKGAKAQEMNGDVPGAIKALQDVAKNYPNDPSSPYALYYIVTIYQKQKDLAGMTSALLQLQSSYPNSEQISPATLAIGKALEAQGKYKEANDLYDKVSGGLKEDLAAYFKTRIGANWLNFARALGAYQSLKPDDKKEALARVTSAEDVYKTVLTTYPKATASVGEAITGLINCLKWRNASGLIQPSDYEATLTQIRDSQTSPEIKGHLNLAIAGLVFDQEDAISQYPKALEQFQKIIADNPDLELTRQESNQYGQLLVAAKKYDDALKIYDKMANQPKADLYTQADADFGLLSVYLAKGKWKDAGEVLNKLEKMNVKWHPNYIDSQLAESIIAEKTGDLETAKKGYAATMQANTPRFDIIGKAMLGYGRVLEAQGNGLTLDSHKENAVYYYTQIDVRYSTGLPDQSAEGIYDAMKVYLKEGKLTEATDLFKSMAPYETLSPYWYKKAKSAAGVQ